MRKHRRLVATGLLAIVTIAALVPGLAAFDQAVLDVVFVLLADDTPAPCSFPAVIALERPDPLLSLLSSRAPPSFLSA